jgi:hypothetical protein
MSHRISRLVLTVKADEPIDFWLDGILMKSAADSGDGGPTHDCRHLAVWISPKGTRAKVVVESCRKCICVLRRKLAMDGNVLISSAAPGSRRGCGRGKVDTSHY